MREEGSNPQETDCENGTRDGYTNMRIGLG